MRIWGLLLLVLLATRPVVGGPRTDFPYDTIVDAEEVYVRSGPGTNYYPTGKLKRGQPVTVYRHDPGAWYMIGPPAGSFSWVRAQHIRRMADGQGVVTANNVVVWVGSVESDIHELFQRKLAEGDEVRILGEKLLPAQNADERSELWYRITPPPGEWRWVNGQTLAPPRPLEGVGKRPGTPAATVVHRPPSAGEFGDFGDQDFAPPEVMQSRQYLEVSQQRRRPVDDDPPGELIERPLVRRKAESAPSGEQRLPPQLESQLAELDRLDVRFRSILDLEPSEWDFAKLVEDYRNLRSRAASTNLQQMIDGRLSKIGGYENVKAQRVELAKLSREVVQRDAELTQQQRAHEARATALQALQYDGAGIVQRSALTGAGAPRYALVAPSGRVLAYLMPAPGVNLEAWIGRSAGVVGSRVPQPQLKSDLITVIRLSPVRLSD